jgi:hypothetical protein
MKNNLLSIAAALLFSIVNLFGLIFSFNGRTGGFNHLVYLVAQEFWPFASGMIFKMFFLTVEALLIFLFLRKISNKWVVIVITSLLILLSLPLLDLSGL